MDLRAMAMKGCSAFLKCNMQDTHCGGLTSLQRCSRYILQPQPTGQLFFLLINTLFGLLVGIR